MLHCKLIFLSYSEKLSDEPDSIQPKVPVTDIDFEHGRVARTSALFQQHLLPKFPSGRQQPSSPQPKPTAPSKATTAPLPISEAFYDSVPHEENVSYIDGNLLLRDFSRIAYDFSV